MTQATQLHPTPCALCGTAGNASELYPANFDPRALNPIVFSARRLPDRIHYRIVRCDDCGLVRSDPAADAELLVQLYARSAFNYVQEVGNLKRTYGHYLAELSHYGVHKGGLLEIGCGNGFFLEEALEQGYSSVHGVEPSLAAVADAGPRVRPNITCDVMRPGLFQPEQFDVICLFQVLDHVSAPGPLLDECLHLLKPGGFVLFINHNVEALSARILKDRSPIIDIEHTYLYSPATISRMALAHGFQVLRVGSVQNSFSLQYLAHLFPLPKALKRVLLALIENLAVGRLRLSLPLGNLYLIARKPHGQELVDGLHT